MMKQLIFGLAMLTLVSCKSANGAEEVKEEAIEAVQEKKQEDNLKPAGVIYSCDGFHNGIASEFIQILYSESGNKVLGIWYWDTNNDTKQRLTVISEEHHNDLGAVTGKLKFPGSDDVYSYSQIEDWFSLTDSDDRSQHFDYLDTEE